MKTTTTTTTQEANHSAL